MTKHYLFAIDNGTQSIRALIFDLDGNLIAKGKEEIEPYFSTQPGFAEQEPDYFWQALKRACDKLWDSSPVKPEQIAGVSITTQRGTVINLDKQGKPLRPAIIWLDQRRADASSSMGMLWDTLLPLAGATNIAKSFREQAQANWIAQNQAELWRNTHKYVLLSGYLHYRLTGQIKDSVGSQVGYLPFDYRRHQWAGKHDLKWKMLPSDLTQAQMAELVKPTELIGTITSEASKHTGLPEGLPVIAAASDKACEILGAGGTGKGIGCMSYGTTATINITSSKYIEPMRFMPPYAAAIPNRYSSEVMIYRGFWMVSWFKREFGLREQHLALERGIEPEQLFDELVNSVPAGSMGLMLQPYWSPGDREPGPEAKGGVIGFGDVHTRAHLYRAILEGLAYALREGSEKLQKRSGLKLHTLRVAGGGSQSDAAMQLTADIFGLPAERPHTYETSGLGAAMDTAVGLGLMPNFDEAIKRMTRVGKRFEPRPAEQALYNRLYQEVYQKMYQQLKPLYQSIRDITGYPS
ncbi:MAG: FGGY-family carbohydrate kinase [Venatoribacter sp.]